MRKSDRPRILIHAVSVGEVNAARLLVEALAEDCEVVLAVTTDTGFARATSLLGDGVQVVRYPLDFSSAVKRFLDAVQPTVVVLVELEVWPNFIAECTRRAIPTCVVNGRLTARSHRRYRIVRSLLRPTFERLAFVAAQTDAYASRFADLGVPAERVLVTGTMKWDTAQIADHVEGAEELAKEMGIDRSKPLVVAGSTAPGEHELLNAALPDGVQLLCAPRKPEWFDQAASALPGCIRRSHGTNTPQSSRSTRFLLDTIGELRMAYALADVVVMGRTFTDLGGSDMIEPVALGKPTIVGPHVSNFQDAVDVLLAGGGLVQTDAARVGDVLRDVLENQQRRHELVERGREVIRRHQGATKRHHEMVLELLNKKSPSQHEAGTAREEKEERAR